MGAGAGDVTVGAAAPEASRARSAARARGGQAFGLTCQTLAFLRYLTTGHHKADAADHRAGTPWYTTKTHPSTADLAAKLRRVLITAQ
jgi:hypothetical protein